MDFFERQGQARRNSFLLYILFTTAILAVLVVLNLSIYALIYFTGIYSVSLSEWIVSEYSKQTTYAFLLIMLAGSAYQAIRLGAEGKNIAYMTGATPVDMDTKDEGLRRFINIAEEMSIASGIPVPELFVMRRESGINAFAAGGDPTQAAIIVTQGCLDELTRDELQGVIGHEFSHILNGDVRINLRLISVLGGLVLLGEVGSFLLRGHGRSYGRDSARFQGIAIILGLILIVIGYIGLLAGRLVRAAVSRQREFLADASSVQFTRNPEGIGSALYKIAYRSHGSRLNHTVYAESINHMCFSESIRLHHWISGWMASHPPVDERLRTLGHSMLAKLRARKNVQALQERHQEQLQVENNACATQAFAEDLPFQLVPKEEPVASKVKDIIRHVGTVDPMHLDYAQAILTSIPSDIRHLTHSTEGAQHLVYALFALQTVPGKRHELLQTHIETESTRTIPQLMALILQLDNLGESYRFPLIELSLTSLRKLPVETRKQFLQTCYQLIKFDGNITLPEYILLSFLKQQLSGDKVTNKTLYHSIDPVLADFVRVLHFLSRFNDDDEQTRNLRVQSIVGQFTSKKAPIVTLETTPQALHEPLSRLKRLSPFLKRNVLEACIDCIMDNNEIRPMEYDLVRLIAETLGCPMPPLVLSTNR